MHRPAFDPGFTPENQQPIIKRWVSVLLIGIVVLFLLFGGSINTVISDDDNTLTVSGMFVSSKQVSLNSINSIRLIENLDTGSRSIGIGTAKVNCGTFSNSTYGNYSLYIYNRNTLSIELTSSDGILVFNLPDEIQTRQFYDQLMSKVTLSPVQ